MSTVDLFPPKAKWSNQDGTLTTEAVRALRPVQANVNDANLISWAAITRHSGFDSFVATPSSSNLRALLTDETGTGAAVFGTAPTIAGGSITGLTTFAIGNSGTGAFDMTVAHNGTLTAGRTLTWNLNDAARSVSLSGNLTVSSAATVSGTNTGDQTSVSGNAGTATALQTPRAIYGNNFDGTAALTQVIASTYGGTGNGFTKFTGPATSEKTFTLPDSNATILYNGGALGTPSSGTLTSCAGGESTWTPGLTLGGTDNWTYTSSGKHTKIGNFIFFEGILTVSVKGAATGAAVITGLPTAAAASPGRVPCSVRINNVTAGSLANGLMANVVGGTSTIQLERGNNAGTTISNILDTDLTATSVIVVAGFYSTA